MVVLSEKDIIPPPPYLAIEHFGTHIDDQEFEPSINTDSPSTSNNPPARHPNAVLAGKAPSLPSQVLLLIVYSTLPTPGEIRRGRRESTEECAVRTTRTLYWMAFCLRSVNRGFYLSSMHLLRSTFLTHYVRHIRQSYSSDPFPHTGRRSGSRSPVVNLLQSESQILDLYILHRLHEDVFSADSSLHMERPDALQDLFDFMQPRARLADLVRTYGVAAGLVGGSSAPSSSDTHPGHSAPQEEASNRAPPLLRASPSSSSLRSLRLSDAPRDALTTEIPAGLKLKAQLARSSSTLTLVQRPATPSSTRARTPTFSQQPRTSLQLQLQPPAHPRRPTRRVPVVALRVTFSPRRIGLMYAPPSSSLSSESQLRGRPRTIVDLPRERDEPLERCASRLIAGLKTWLDTEGTEEGVW